MPEVSVAKQAALFPFPAKVSHGPIRRSRWVKAAHKAYGPKHEEFSSGGDGSEAIHDADVLRLPLSVCISQPREERR